MTEQPSTKKQKVQATAEKWCDCFKEKLSVANMENLGRARKQGAVVFGERVKSLLQCDCDEPALAADGWDQFTKKKVDEIVKTFEESSEEKQAGLKAAHQHANIIATARQGAIIDAANVFWDYCHEEFSSLFETNSNSMIGDGFQSYYSRQTQTVEDVLKDLSPNDRDSPTGIQNIATEMNAESKRAYYLPWNGCVNFRHEGEMMKRPPKIYLQDLSDDTDYANKVLVFYSASGSGKTVELVGSSVSRNADLTIVVSPRDDDDPKDDPEVDGADVAGCDREGADRSLNLSDKEEQESQTGTNLPSTNTHTHTIDKDEREREEDKSAILRKLMEDIAKEYRSVFDRLLDAAERRSKELSVVVAIDEASNCPNMVRSIIRATANYAGYMSDAIKGNDRTDKFAWLKVQFSVAGTGASAGTAGSIAESFKVVEPNFARNPDVRKNLLRGLTPLIIRGGGGEPQSLVDCIDEHLPVVNVMMENGRMASIACAALREHPREVPVVESSLVATIATKFMKSNALERLADHESDRHLIAASALAVHLFRGAVSKINIFPNAEEEYEKVVQNMSFALDLVGDNSKEADGRVKKMVSKYGLLEPNTLEEEQKWEKGAEVKNPFVMRSSQVLMVFFLLDVDVASMLELSPYGFEVLTTHMLKCVVAASLTVNRQKRPSLRDVLSTVGFKVCEMSTHADICAVWEKLQGVTAIGFKCTSEKEGKISRKTRQLDAELLPVLVPVGEDGTTEERMVVDKILHGALSNLVEDPESFATPIACVNYGNSAFADGFVTFWVEGKDNTGNMGSWKFTIMNQSKDYHNGTTLNIKKLEDHANLGRSEFLDPVFGSARLLCVSSTTDVLLARRSCELKRNFLPYCVDDSSLLKALLSKLASQRNLRDRVKKCAFLCDKNGDYRQVGNEPEALAWKLKGKGS